MRKLVILSVASIAGRQRGARPTDAVAISQSAARQAPFTTPYGEPIGLSRAENAIAAAIAESVRRGWTMSVAVVDSGTNLVAFVAHGRRAARLGRNRRAQGASRRARSAGSTRAFEDAAHGGAAVLSLDGVIASAGGVPLVDDGKLIGAIGCSGGTSAQDETICLAGAATINGAGN